MFHREVRDTSYLVIWLSHPMMTMASQSRFLKILGALKGVNTYLTLEPLSSLKRTLQGCRLNVRRWLVRPDTSRLEQA